MKKHLRVSGLLALTILAFLGFLSGCSSDSASGDVPHLTADMESLPLTQSLYYPIDAEARTIAVAFNMPVDRDSVQGNIVLSDKTGSLADNYELSIEGNRVVVHLDDGFRLRPGWKYLLSINDQVRSRQGTNMSGSEIFELRTTASAPFATGPDEEPLPDTARTSIVAISDIHMGDARAQANGYCWFGENKDALSDFLTKVRDNPEFRDLVILGDLFDEWLIPFSTKPFDGAVTDSRDYFRSVRNAETNAEIFDKLAQISSGGDMNLVYVRGNHDMLMDPITIDELLPGAVFRGEIDGLGSYSPANGIVIEHGHRYDFFNCPQPLANPGHILPPGYFVSRLWAAGMEAQAGPGALSSDELAQGPFGDNELAFPVAWDAALIYSEAQFPALTPPNLNDAVILMTGIDGFNAPLSFMGAKNTYINGNIETLWPQTQAQNGVQAPMPVAVSILNGHSDLLFEADAEYLENKNRGVRIVVFGHTHEPMLKVYPALGTPTGIYANTGSWVNEASAGYIGGCAYKVRTFVVISPAAWTGSDLDVVTLYQYNRAADETSWQAVKLAEESVDVSQ